MFDLWRHNTADLWRHNLVISDVTTRRTSDVTTWWSLTSKHGGNTNVLIWPHKNPASSPLITLKLYEVCPLFGKKLRFFWNGRTFDDKGDHWALNSAIYEKKTIWACGTTVFVLRSCYLWGIWLLFRFQIRCEVLESCPDSRIDWGIPWNPAKNVFLCRLCPPATMEP